MRTPEAGPPFQPRSEVLRDRYDPLAKYKVEWTLSSHEETQGQSLPTVVMSSGIDPSEAAEIVAEQFEFMVEDFILASIAALIAFDYVSTIQEEVELFWRQNVTGSTVIFLFNRYFTVIYNVGFGLVILPSSLKSCKILFMSTLVIEYAQLLPWAAFTTLRAIALSDQKWAVGLVLGVLNLGSIVVEFVRAYYRLSFFEDASGGCDVTYNISPQFGHAVAIAQYAVAVLSNIIVLVVTWKKTYHSRRDTELSQGSLAHVLFRDGALYFICLFALDTFHVIFTVKSIALPQNRELFTSYISFFTAPFTSILIAHFLIDLQEANRSSLGDRESSESVLEQVDTLRFNRVMGSIAQTLTYEQSQAEQEVEGEDYSQTD